MSAGTARPRRRTGPRVSIVVPCRDEKEHVRDCIQGVLAGEHTEGGFEILVVDGMSSDGTREIVGELCGADDRVRMIDNPGRTTPRAMNVGIRAARGEIIVLLSAHATCAPDYVLKCVEVLDRTGAWVVGGPCRAVGKGYVGRAVAAAFQCPFAMGGGKAHDLEYEGPLDTVYLGCFRKERIIEVGLFDEELTRSQDDELNFRVNRQGGIVYQSPEIRCQYTPRGSLSGLFRQSLRDGFWKVRVVQKHGRPASMRHVVPIGFVVAIVAGAILSPLHWAVAVAYAAFWALYLTANATASVLVARKGRWVLLPILPLTFFCFHFAYGSGFLLGLIHFVLFRRRGGNAWGWLARHSR